MSRESSRPNAFTITYLMRFQLMFGHLDDAMGSLKRILLMESPTTTGAPFSVNTFSLESGMMVLIAMVIYSTVMN